MATSLVLSGPDGRSMLRQYYDTAMSSVGMAKHHIRETASSIRAGGEAGVVGAILGAAHASLPNGLDYQAKIGNQVMDIPIDGVAAVMGLAGAAFLPQAEEYGADLRNSGAAAFAILTFRKTASFVAKKRQLAGMSTGGVLASGIHGESEIGEDPIIRRAREIANK